MTNAANKARKLSPIERSVKGWIESGCGCPVVARVENWGCPGCSRWVVNVKFAGPTCGDRFYGEFDSRAAAQRSANAVNGWVSRYCDRYEYKPAA